MYLHKYLLKLISFVKIDSSQKYYSFTLIKSIKQKKCFVTRFIKTVEEKNDLDKLFLELKKKREKRKQNPMSGNGGLE